MEGLLDRLLHRIEDVPPTEREAETPVETAKLEDYHILGELGRGGMGIVYAAREKAGLRRLVALKFLPGHLSMSASSRERIRREAKAASRLDHAHLVGMHAMGEKDGAPFLVMELVAGVPLSALLRIVWGKDPSALQGPDLYRAFCAAWRDLFGPVAGLADLHAPSPEWGENPFWIQPYPAILARWAEQIARALACAHGAEILHRDVKPSNVLILSSGEAKLVDFGLARDEWAASMTQSEEFVGTLYYAAPEAILSKEGQRSPSCDIYSLGMVLYEALALENPFQSDDRSRAIHRIASFDPQPPSRRNAAVGPALETICMTAIQKEPGLRYASAREFADDLERFRLGQPIAARALGPWTRRLRRARRQSAAAAIPVLASALALAAGAWLWSDFSSPSSAVETPVVPAASTAQAPAALPPGTIVRPTPLAETVSVAPSSLAAPSSSVTVQPALVSGTASRQELPPVLAVATLPPIGEAERRLANGAGFFAAQLFQPAREALQKILSADGDDLVARTLLAAAHAQIRNYAAAKVELAPAVAKRPDSASLLALQAWILQRLGAFAEAAAVSRQPRRDYADAEEDVARFSLCVLQRDYRGAVNALDRIAAREPQLAWPALPKGIILAFEQPQKALEILERFETRAPRDPLTLTSLGYLWHAMQDSQRAQTLFELALEIDPEFEYAAMGLSSKVGSKTVSDQTPKRR